jgi:hypothetical protein
MSIVVVRYAVENGWFPLLRILNTTTSMLFGRVLHNEENTHKVSW